MTRLKNICHLISRPHNDERERERKEKGREKRKREKEGAMGQFEAPYCGSLMERFSAW